VGADGSIGAAAGEDAAGSGAAALHATAQNDAAHRANARSRRRGIAGDDTARATADGCPWRPGAEVPSTSMGDGMGKRTSEVWSSMGGGMGKRTSEGRSRGQLARVRG